MIKGSAWFYNRLNAELAEAEEYVDTHGVAYGDELVAKKAVKALLGDILGMYRLGVMSGVIDNG